MSVSTQSTGLTVEDYYRMGEEGFFAEDARVELLDGEIIEMFPIGPFNANSTQRVSEYFIRLGKGLWTIRTQLPVRLNDRSEPEPDVALVRPLGDEYNLRHPTPDDVFLLVEVSDSSLRYDQGQKLAAYARAGIREYWILNLVERCIIVHRQPSPTGVYGSVARLCDDDPIAPEAFPEVVARVADVLKG